MKVTIYPESPLVYLEAETPGEALDLKDMANNGLGEFERKKDTVRDAVVCLRIRKV